MLQAQLAVKQNGIILDRKAIFDIDSYHYSRL